MTAGSGGAPGRGVLPNVLPSTPPVGIPPQRVTMLNRLPENTADGEYVVYWMSAAQRAASNPALEFAVFKSNQHRLPLLVLFCLTDNYPEAYERHYAFMLEGLVEVNVALRERGIKFAVVHGVAPDPVLAAARKASCVVTDCAYMRLLRGWRMALANEAQVAVFEVEGEVIVPSKLLMDKRDDFAASFRPRLMSHIKDFLVDVSPEPDPSRVFGFTILDLGDATEEATEKVLLALDLNRSVPRVTAGGDADDEPLRGGASRALRHLARFFGDDPASGVVAQEQAAAKATTRPRDRAIDAYAEQRNNFSKRKQSHLSPYLHFGHISVVAIALHARAFLAANPEQQRDVDVFWDELVVRREFAVHFVKQHPGDYDSPTCLPVWAREGLRKHECDARERVYSATELEQGRTKDAVWNAAQLEMVVSGKMHNFLRMYWAKRVIGWTRTLEEAYAWVLAQNNKWELDGRGANAFAGVAWCFGYADQPFPDRPIFGPVRSMTAGGLSRKFDKAAVDRYVQRVAALRRERKGRLPEALAFARLAPASAFFQTGAAGSPPHLGQHKMDGPAADGEQTSASVSSNAGHGGAHPHHRGDGGRGGGGSGGEAGGGNILATDAGAGQRRRGHLRETGGKQGSLLSFFTRSSSQAQAGVAVSRKRARQDGDGEPTSGDSMAKRAT